MKQGNDPSSFEYMELTFRYQSHSFLFVVVYRPPSSSMNVFIDEFRTLLEDTDVISQYVFIVGDFNIWMDDPNRNSTLLFRELLESHQLQNNVTSVTSSTEHMLDLIITDATKDIINNTEVEAKCTISPTHRLVSFCIPLLKSKVTKKIVFRNKSNFSPVLFIHEVCRKMDTDINSPCVHNNCVRIHDCKDCLVNIYDSIIKSMYENLCLYLEKDFVVKDNSPWFNGELMNLKREKGVKNANGIG